MELDWILTGNDGGLLLVARRGVDVRLVEEACSCRLQPSVRRESLPRWMFIVEPTFFRLEGRRVDATLLESLFKAIGPVGSTEGTATWAGELTHPTVGRLVVRTTPPAFGLYGDAARTYADTILGALPGWKGEANSKQTGLIFRPRDAAIQPQGVWGGVLVALAIAAKRDAAQTDISGWRLALTYALNQLRTRIGTARASDALLTTVDLLLEHEASGLARRRVEEYLRDGGSVALANRYNAFIAWSESRWGDVISSAAGVGDRVDADLVWRAAWAELELSKPEAARARLAALGYEPPAATRTGAWFRITHGRLALAQGDLPAAITAVAAVPNDTAVATAKGKLEDALSAALQARPSNATPLDLTALPLGRLSERLQNILRSLPPSGSAARPAPALREDRPSLEALRRASTQGQGSTEELARDAVKLLIEGTIQALEPQDLAMVVDAIVMPAPSWTPSPSVLSALDVIPLGADVLARTAASLARAFLRAKRLEQARSWATLASHSLHLLDALGCQAVAESLEPQRQEARSAWLRLLAEPPRWSNRPALGAVSDVVRWPCVARVAEELYVTGELSSATELLLRELQASEFDGDFWKHREQASLLVTVLVDADRRLDALDMAQRLLEGALAASDGGFINEKLRPLFEQTTYLAPLSDEDWLDILDTLAAYADRLAALDLGWWTQDRLFSMLARASTGSRRNDALVGKLADLGAALGVEIPPAFVGAPPVPSGQATAPARPNSVLIVGGDARIQERAKAELQRRGAKVKLLDPGFEKRVDESEVRQMLAGVDRVVLVWRCILHYVTYMVDGLLKKPEFKRVEKVYARGKGHGSIVEAALTGIPS
jgi:hypothetical protein